ncbi:MAG: ClpXP protease specificity-enhancing factor [Pseudomonadota bacterium]
MTSSQPYLIRAIYEWIVDNNLTPYLMVDATRKGAIVPEDYLDEQGRIILNISPSATSELLMNNEEVTFNARFSGQAIGIVVPTYCVKAIYARENGQGMMFNDEGNEESEDSARKKKRALLESVRTDTQSDATASVSSDSPPDKTPPAGSSPAGNGAAAKGKGRKGPNLKVVK